jgi:mersacidin/lichenicidin family type 2 lantibiotic
MKFDIARAWKDQTYRENLSAEQRCQLPANPAGEIELGEADLASVYGGDGWDSNGTYRGNGWSEDSSPYHCDGWDGNGGFDAQRNSSICSILCSHTCRIGILDLLSPR